MKKVLFTDGWFYGLYGEEKKPVILPHDAMQLQKRVPDAPSGSGCAYFPGGIYCYEKIWNVSEDLIDKKLILHFEAVYRNTDVYLNGVRVGGRKYGYTPFWIDVTDIVKVGENKLEVVADNSQTPNSRWYSGGGIYRPVWLWVGEKAYIKPCGIKVKTSEIRPEQSAAKIHVSVDAVASSSCVIEILYAGDVVASAIGAMKDGMLETEFEIADAKLWDEEHPELYECKVILKDNEEIVDAAKISFGIRIVSCSKNGLYINGKETLLRGGCIHSDNGIIGAASFAEAEFRKVALLKKAGFNALRIAHNPASPALLDACDRLGMYVMDEGWDMWYKRKTMHDYGMDFMENYEEDIRLIVDTDYNHPSVIMYSIGNEVSEPATEEGIALGEKLADGFKALDDTRLTTIGCNITILAGSRAGNDTFDPDSGKSSGDNPFANGEMNSTMFNEIISKLGGMMEGEANSPEADEASSPIFEKVDVAGYNYASGRYPLDGKLHPDRVIVGAETFPQYIYRNWQMVKEYSYLIGDFMWTAIDYIGEVGIGGWSYTKDGIGFDKPYPWLLGEVGALDLNGQPNGEMFMANAAWDQIKEPKISVSPDVMYPGIVPAKGGWRGTNSIPSWSFRDCKGNRTAVEVYACAPIVELVLNGNSLGKKETKEGYAVYELNYEPGEIKAIAYDEKGETQGCSSLDSAEGELSMRLTLEEGSTPAYKGKVIFVDLDIVGENGVVESNADCKVTLNVEGGTLLGFGSARPRSEETFISGTYTTYYGRALAAILVESDEAVCVTATAEDMFAKLVIAL